MKKIHHIHISVFASDDVVQVKEALQVFLPENFEEEKIQLVDDYITIKDGTDIHVLKIVFEKQRHTKEVIAVLKELLSEEQIETIKSQENRVDKDGELFIRIDKKSFVEKNEAVLVDHGDCVHIKIMTACYPKNRENALKIVKELFE